VNVETVRYYQRRGLLDTPAKPPGSQRRYNDAALQRLIFIRNAQKLAFTLSEVERLLAVPDAKGCKAVREVAREKLVFLGERIAEIDRVRKRLQALIERCDDSPDEAGSAIIVSLLAAASDE